MITDGTFICGLCGEWRIRCALCGSAPLVDIRDQIEAERIEQRKADGEMHSQEQAIRRAAENRRSQ